jgi:hypothetical protein
MACSMLVILYIGCRTRLFTRHEIISRAGISLTHLSYILLFAAGIFLFDFVTDSHSLKDAADVVPLRKALSLAAAWVVALAVSAALVCWGQTKREQLREEQIAAGRVWTAAASLGHNLGTNIVQRHVDVMSDEELVVKARPWKLDPVHEDESSRTCQPWACVQ